MNIGNIINITPLEAFDRIVRSWLDCDYDKFCAYLPLRLRYTEEGKELYKRFRANPCDYYYSLDTVERGIFVQWLLTRYAPIRHTVARKRKAVA